MWRCIFSPEEPIEDRCERDPCVELPPVKLPSEADEQKRGRGPFSGRQFVGRVQERHGRNGLRPAGDVPQLRRRGHSHQHVRLRTARRRHGTTESRQRQSVRRASHRRRAVDFRRRERATRRPFSGSYVNSLSQVKSAS